MKKCCLFIIILLFLAGAGFLVTGSLCYIDDKICEVINKTNSFTLLIFGISFTGTSLIAILILVCIIKCVIC